MTISQKLQKIHKYSGKTQEELARDLKVSFPTINSWINGKSQPRSEATHRINALYIDIFGDTSIESHDLGEKIEKLQQLQRQLPNPFSLLMSRKDLYDNLLLSLTYHTNSIEGSTFTEPDVRAVLFDDVTIPNKTVREHQEAKNHQGALGLVMRRLKSGTTDVDEELIKHLHQIMMNGIMHNVGIFRTHSVRIAGVHVPTSNHLSIHKHMKAVITRCNQPRQILIEQVSQMAQTHAQFEQIHPFSDGNGRVGRLLLQVLASKYRLAPVLIKRERKQAYYTYLEEAQMKQNIVPLTSFIIDSIVEGYKLIADVA